MCSSVANCSSIIGAFVNAEKAQFFAIDSKVKMQIGAAIVRNVFQFGNELLKALS